MVMKKILQELEDYMVLKNYSLATRKAYLNAAKNFYLWCEAQQDNPVFDPLSECSIPKY